MRFLGPALSLLAALGCRRTEPSGTHAEVPVVTSTGSATSGSAIEITGLSSDGLVLSWTAPPGAHAGTIYHVSVDTGWTWQGTGTRAIYGTTDTTSERAAGSVRNVSRSFPPLEAGRPVRWVVVAFAEDGTILAMSKVTVLVVAR